MKRTIAIAALLLFCTVAASAQTLVKYKAWEQSPEAYFLTAEERVEWRAVTSDEAAEAFLNAFRARRGGEAFTKELKTRIYNADKYLSIGAAKGSRSLRGKAVILFGAPINIAVDDRTVTRGYTTGDTPATPGGSPGMGTGELRRKFRDFTFTFPAKTNLFFGSKDYVVIFETDTATGKEKLGKNADQKHLDDLFEAAAKASIKQ